MSGSDELQIVINAKDNASKALRQVRTDVKQLESQLQSAERTFAKTGRGADHVNSLKTSLAGAYGESKRLGAEYGTLKSKADQLSSAVTKQASAFERANTLVQKHSTNMKIAGAAMGAGLVMLSKDWVGEARKFSAASNSVNVTFGEAAQGVTTWSEDSAAKLKLSQSAALGAVSQIAMYGKQAGMTGNDLAAFSQKHVELATDIASFKGADVSDVIESMGSAFRGEMDPIEKYGVLLNQATLQQIAFEEGITETNDALTPHQKVLAVSAALYRQTTDAQGDAARTGEKYGNQLKETTANWDDFGRVMGEVIIPPLNTLLGVAKPVLQWAKELPAPVRTAGLGLAFLGAAALIAAPRVMSMVASSRMAAAANLQLAASSRASGTAMNSQSSAMSRMRGPAMAAGTALGALGVAAMIAHSFKAAEVNIDQLTLSLEEYSRTSQIAGVAQEYLGEGMNGLVEDTSRLIHHSDWLGQINNTMGSIFGGQGALDTARDKWSKIDQILQDIESRDPASAATLFDQFAAAAERAGAPVEKLKSDLLPGYSAAQQRAAEATASAASASGRAASANSRYASSLQMVDARLKQSSNVDSFIRARQALGKSIQENGRQFRGSSQAALANRDALRGAFSAAMAKAGESEGAYRKATGAIRRQMQAMGYSKKEAKGLTDQFALAEKKADALGEAKPEVKVEDQDVDRAKTNAQTYLDKLNELDARGPVTTTIIEKTEKVGGDTRGPMGVGGSYGATLAAHSALSAAAGGGYSVLSGMRSTNLGSAGSDHRHGRAIDVQGRNLPSYAAAVKRMGGYAAIHGTGSNRHLHVVPQTRNNRGGSSGPSFGDVHISIGNVSEYVDAQQAGREAAREFMAEQTRLQRSRR